MMFEHLTKEFVCGAKRKISEIERGKGGREERDIEIEDEGEELVEVDDDGGIRIFKKGKRLIFCSSSSSSPLCVSKFE